MTDRELMQQALETLEECTAYTSSESWSPSMTRECEAAITALREALAQPEQEPANYKELLNKSEARLHDVAVHCERVERRLKDVNTAAMNLTHDLVCMDYDDDDRLNRDRVMGRIMQWRNEWDKAMQNNQLQMQPEQGPMKHGGRPMTLRECMEAEEPAQPEQEPRQWQGLTRQEFLAVTQGLEDLEDCWMAIEAKLKEKNT